MRALAVAASVLALAACGGGDGGTSGPSAGAPVPGGGLSVEEALASEVEEPLLVKGYVIGRADELRLCSAILESYPPQCGEPSLRIEGDVGVDLQEEGDARWTDEQVSVPGEVEDGTIRVSETST